MDSNAFLLSFGMKPEDFERTEGPIESDEGFVYEGWEVRKSPTCPACGSASCVIHNRYKASIRLRSDILKAEILSKVAATYRKWENEIARGLAKNEFGKVFANAKVEARNDISQTMIDAAYGYHNFERFRKRFLLMRWNKRKKAPR